MSAGTYATSDGAVLAYDDRGPRGAIPLLFLHGWHGAGAVWSLVRDALTERHRTLAVDLRGFGGSNAAPGPYTIDTFANDLSDLLAALDLDPLVAIGHSMGAKVALRFAIDRPEAVEGLVLVAPVPPGRVDVTPAFDAILRATAGNPEKANAWLGKLVASEPRREIIALMRAAAAATPPHVALESLDSWTSVDFAHEARTIVTPTLVLAPEADRPQVARERVADLIEGSRFETVPEAGHYVPLERPDRLAAAIDAFVDGL